MKKIKMIVKQKISSTKLPLTEKEFINLDKLAKYLKQNGFNFSYNAEFGFNAVYIKFNNVCFLVFQNGSCTSTGSLSLSKQNKLINELWRDIKKFIKKY